ncbi:MAG: methyltransferase domain-containing protein [Deltaproteobacteria bacterium]|nr:methyltransferase domain-containing protein [Deltaproteobacteria bacterium]
MPPRRQPPRPQKAPTHPKPTKGGGPGLRERPPREDLVTQACLEAFGAAHREGRLADRALESTLRKRAQLFANERRAVAERTYALLRRLRTVDFLLGQVRPGFSALNASRQDLLRFGASRVFQGESAATVQRHLGLDSQDGEALAHLPEAAAALEALPREERYPLAASLPDELAALFLREFGTEAEVAAEAMNERAPLCVRVNTLKTTREALRARLADEGVGAEPTPRSPLGLLLDGRLNAFALPSFRDGLFEVQDEGSQLLGLLVDPPPTRVVDACAGAGGKALQLAAEMKNRGELFALDVEEGRLEELKRRARRAGVHNVRTRAIPADASALEALQDLVGRADRVLVDAPCTGSGTLRRKPDARYRFTAALLAEHVARQQALLARFAPLVKPGGQLVYGTCSVLREENEAVVEGFLAAHPDFSLKPAAERLPANAADAAPAGYLRLFPHRHGTDGFFGAILLRKKG